MAIDWTADERPRVETAVAAHPVKSGRCAALARVVFAVGCERDAETVGRHVRPRGAARFVVPKHPDARLWWSHTFVETHGHAVDALTGAGGHPADAYRAEFWEFPETLSWSEVDVSTIDPGIQVDS